jgi:hypothetical protein
MATPQYSFQNFEMKGATITLLKTTIIIIIICDLANWDQENPLQGSHTT